MAVSLAVEDGTSNSLPEVLGEGWTGESALALGVYCAMAAADFKGCILLAVNTGGDSDSIGAVAGAIKGCETGVSGLPAEWLDVVECRDVLDKMAVDIESFGSSLSTDGRAFSMASAVAVEKREDRGFFAKFFRC